MKLEQIVGIATFVVVAGGVAIGFATIGPPQHMRLVEFDRQRVVDLGMLASDLRNRQEIRGNHLPDRLTDSARPHDGQHDPATRKLYEYRREGLQRFQLCATFALPSDVAERDDAWAHGAGRTCYHFDLSHGTDPIPQPTPAAKR